MKILIFAGGAGTRLWPLSRKNTPKQFEKFFNGKSTVQMAVERVVKKYKAEDIIISTNEKYVALIKEQVPYIPTQNIVAEPEKRDVAPAIGYNLIRLRKMGYQGSVAILWSDHLMKRVNEFLWALKTGDTYVKEHPKIIVFIGEKARYAENNLGWIHVGKKIKPKFYSFLGWKYRPANEDCKKMFDSGEWIWNPGYIVLNAGFVLSLYKKHMPEMYKKLQVIEKSVGTAEEAEVLNKVYPTLESIHFDNAISEKVKPSEAVVLEPDMGWSDPGTLYALKEALQKNQIDNVTRGQVLAFDSQDCLVLNYQESKMVAVVGLEGCIIVNMHDAMIVVKKEDVPKVKKLVEELQNKGFSQYI